MSPKIPHSKKQKHLRWTWRKPPDKPKRPLSAYNLFFADVRRSLLNERCAHGVPKHGLGFGNLARTVATQWKEIDRSRKRQYELQAEIEHEHYQMELARWKLKHACPEPDQVRSCRSTTRRSSDKQTQKAPKKNEEGKASHFARVSSKPDRHNSNRFQGNASRSLPANGQDDAPRLAYRPRQLESQFIVQSVKIKQKETSIGQL